MTDVQPPRGAFVAATTTSAKRDAGSGPQRIHREITERWAAKGDFIGLMCSPC